MKVPYSPLQQYWNSMADSFVNADIWVSDQNMDMRREFRISTFILWYLHNLNDSAVYLFTSLSGNHSGTKRERGLSRDNVYLEDSGNTFGTEEMYDLPFGITSRLSSQSWVRYIPFCPWRGHRSQ